MQGAFRAAQADPEKTSWLYVVYIAFIIDGVESLQKTPLKNHPHTRVGGAVGPDGPKVTRKGEHLLRTPGPMSFLKTDHVRLSYMFKAIALFATLAGGGRRQHTLGVPRAASKRAPKGELGSRAREKSRRGPGGTSAGGQRRGG